MSNGEMKKNYPIRFPLLIVTKRTNIIAYVYLYVSPFIERLHVHNVDINLILCFIKFI